MTQDEVVGLLERKGYREVHHFMDGDDLVYVMEKRKGLVRLMGQVEADGSVNGVDVQEFLRSQQASLLASELVGIVKSLMSSCPMARNLR